LNLPFVSIKKLIAETQNSYQAGRLQGQADILQTPLGWNTNETSLFNNYVTYDVQVNELYKMYYARMDLGNDITGTLIDNRVALICGEGVSIISKRKSTQKWINNFLKESKLNSIKLSQLVTHGEMEGKQLILFNIDKNKEKINLKQILWYDYHYVIEVDKKDKEKIIGIYVEKEGKEKEYFSLDRLVFVKIGGRPEELNETPTKVGSVIQNIKNLARAYYDLRRSNHLFGFPTPAVECKDKDDVKVASKSIKDTNWKPGNTFVSTGRMYYPIPPNSYQNLESEIALNVKIISSRTGDPVHWLGWVDLMSNRAVSHDLNEFIQAGTKVERMIWADSVKDIIVKAMQLSIDNGFSNAPKSFDDDFEVELPYISLEYIDRLNTTWLPLQMNGVISMAQLRNKIPGINPQETEELVQIEKEQNIEDNKEMLGQPENKENTDEEKKNEEAENVKK
jgi:hypothetical protein